MMPLPGGSPIELDPRTALGRAVARGRDAFVRKHVTGVDDAYRRAVSLAPSHTRLWTALAVDHAAQLTALGRIGLALQRCDEYLETAGPGHLDLVLLRAEIRSAAGHHAGVEEDVATIRKGLQDRLWSLSAEHHGRLLRAEGLAAANRGDQTTAVRLLTEASRAFRSAGHQVGVAAVHEDRRLLALRDGDELAAAEVLAGPPPQTAADHLRHAIALRSQLRYEDALQLVLGCVDDPDLDPALRLPVLAEIALLRRLTRDDEAAEEMSALLREAAGTAPDPVAAAATVLRSSARWYALDTSTDRPFHRHILDIRRLVEACSRRHGDDQVRRDLGAADQRLARLRLRIGTDRDAALWHLTAGELELVRHTGLAKGCLKRAVDHFTTAAARSEAVALRELQILALRLAGRAHLELDQQGLACRSWNAAHLLEEDIAQRQCTDQVRVRMMLAAPDEHDLLIDAAAQTLDHVLGSAAGAARTAKAAAAVVVAMEGSHGATILDGILPTSGRTRDLPQLGDAGGAWRWVRAVTRGLPTSQIVWIMHATPERLHHVLLGRTQLHHIAVAVRRSTLAEAIENHMACWSAEVLTNSVVSGQFDSTLATIARLANVDAVLSRLPENIDRIAVVTGGPLAEVPFPAIPLLTTTAPASTKALLGQRFAFSELPCLSALRPLRSRSRRQRGRRALVVRPPAADLVSGHDLPGPTVLAGAEATPTGLRTALTDLRPHLVRIDCHGRHVDRDPTTSWVQLAPDTPAGRLTPDGLEEMDLSHCATFVLGACDSARTRPRGRDERTGFVRAAVLAGAASVVAARWAADDRVAALVLDGFAHHLRALPRDQALQHAQLDVYETAGGAPGSAHPAWWACWMLHGNSGWQTRSAPMRRRWRRTVLRWRNSDPHRAGTIAASVPVIRRERSADGREARQGTG
jgi:hypothetical protein